MTTVTRWTLVLSFTLLLAVAASLSAQPDEQGVSVIIRPERTFEQIEKIYSQMPPLRYTPPADRWKNLPRTAGILHKHKAELRIIMLGDSIVNDTSRSSWELLLQRRCPDVKITRISVVRGSTGCWWYREPRRVQRYVLAHRPDLLIIGGISQRDDTASIRDVLHQVRAASPCDVILMSGAFGGMDPRDDKQWRFDIDPKGKDYRARLMRLAAKEQGAFLDLTAIWGRYIRESGKDLSWFKRDRIHANERGEQILGRVLAAYLSPDPQPTP